jgi:hypothetical protein
MLTGSAGGLIPLLALPRVKLALRLKESALGECPEGISSLALNALKGTPMGGGIMPTPRGSLPAVTVAHHRVAGRVDHRNGIRGKIRNIGACSVGGNSYSKGAPPYRDRGYHRVGRGIDNRNGIGALIRNIDVFPIGGNGNPNGITPTGTVATTVLLAVSMTETLLEK